MLAWIVAGVLAVLLVVAGFAVLVLRGRLRETRTELEQVRSSIREVAPTSRSGQAAHAAGLAVRTVLETATSLRDRGWRGTVLASLDEVIRWAREDRTEIVRIAGPDGTVTFLFTDIEDSTTLTTELGDVAWMRVLEAHDRVLTGVIERHHGHVVKHQGDGYMVVFSTPTLAARAALDIQAALTGRPQHRALRRTPIRVRIGLHCGTAVEREGDWFGRTVAQAARVAALAEGGETLVSEEVAQALEEAEVELHEVDTVELKGLPGTHTVWRVEETSC